MQNVYKLVIGDWSQDGHQKSEFFYFRCNLPDADIKAAYLKACEQIGVGLHRVRKGETHTAICAKYEEHGIPLVSKAKLSNAGVDFKKVGGLEEHGEWSDISPASIAIIFLEMVRVVRPEFQWEAIKDQTPCINGFWSKDFNIGFGYGVFE